MRPYQCPVCGGRGQVPPDFYNPGNAPGLTAASWQTCRACGGNGVMWGGTWGEPAERPPNWHKGWQQREVSVPFVQTPQWGDDSYTLTVSDAGDYEVWN